MMFTKKLLLCISTIFITANAQKATSINECPQLTPRNISTDVRDLRPDDIKYIGALGDSITAGFGIMNHDPNLPKVLQRIASFYEHRGLSYAIGGDKDANTIPNYIRHYQSNISGYSIGKHLSVYCNAFDCTGRNEPVQDQLNAASTGSIAMNLESELNYFIPRMKRISGKGFDTEWKLINIQIGSNDMCGACNSTYMSEVTPEKYGAYVESAISRIQKSIPKVLINLIGTFDLSPIFSLTHNHPYCEGAVRKSPTGYGSTSCSCSTTPEGLSKMKALSLEYNKKLHDIYQKYKLNQTSNFAVAYQHSNIRFETVPVDFFTDIDCFHPSLKGHKWISKILWNQLFTHQDKKPDHFDFNPDGTLYCPTDSDRIVT